MAKEKKDATSLFDAMNKNRIKTTRKVNNQSEKTTIDRNEQNLSVEEKTSNLADDSHFSSIINEDIMTDEVKISTQNTQITHDVYKNEKSSAELTQSSVPSKHDKELQHIHIALPKDVYDKMEIAKKAYYNNKTTYIRNLILDDFEKNREIYEKLPNIR